MRGPRCPGDPLIRAEHAAQQGTPREQDPDLVRESEELVRRGFGRGDDEQQVRTSTLGEGRAARRNLGHRRRVGVNTDDERSRLRLGERQRRSTVTGTEIDDHPLVAGDQIRDLPDVDLDEAASNNCTHGPMLPGHHVQVTRRFVEHVRTVGATHDDVLDARAVLAVEIDARLDAERVPDGQRLVVALDEIRVLAGVQPDAVTRPMDEALPVALGGDAFARVASIASQAIPGRTAAVAASWAPRSTAYRCRKRSSGPRAGSPPSRSERPRDVRPVPGERPADVEHDRFAGPDQAGRMRRGAGMPSWARMRRSQRGLVMALIDQPLADLVPTSASVADQPGRRQLPQRLDRRRARPSAAARSRPGP